MPSRILNNHPIIVLKKEMANYSSTLALKISWTEELGAGYYAWGCKESDTTERLHLLHYLTSITQIFKKLLMSSSCRVENYSVLNA